MKDKWSPALQIRTVLLSIQALLSAPNPDDPLANDVAEKWKSAWKWPRRSCHMQGSSWLPELGEKSPAGCSRLYGPSNVFARER